MNATASDVANKLGLSRARISQLTSAGQLDGCFSGDGRSRRYDLTKVAARLARDLDPGQSLGHGAARHKAVKSLTASTSASIEADDDDQTTTPAGDDRYQEARIAAIEEKVREQKRRNAREDGTYALASEVAREVQTQMTAEIAGFEAMLPDAARAIADGLHVNAGEALKILRDTWRAHRTARQSAKSTEADAALMTEAEREADI